MKRKQTKIPAGGNGIFQGELPKDVLKELPEEIRRQYFLWDEILKREAELYPYLLLPLIEEIFHRHYPEDAKIVFLATEYVVSRAEGKDGRILHSVYSDLVIQVEDRDIYHLECQMRRNRGMVVRMMEYDLHIAMSHGMEKAGKGAEQDLHMFLPHSAILYLEHGRNTPDHEKCRIHFQDGGSCLFRVPVLKVQDYTPEQIEQKKLFLLIPFVPIRIRKYLKKDGERLYLEETAEQELTGLLKECMIILNRQAEDGGIEDSVRRDIADFLWKACAELFGKVPEVLKEVQEIMRPVIRLMRDDIEELQQEIAVLRKKEEEHRKKEEEHQKKEKELLQEIEKLRARQG